MQLEYFENEALALTLAKIFITPTRLISMQAIISKNTWLAALALSSLLLFSCKKDNEKVVSPDDNTLSVMEDQNDLKNEGDQTNTDINDALENFSTINGRVARKLVCGCSIDSIGPKTIRLRYDNNTPCGSPSRTRGGTITFTLIKESNWRQPGAVIKIDLENYEVTRLSNGKRWIFNGTKYLTNVKGHLIYPQFLLGTDSLLYRERARNIQVSIRQGANSIGNMQYDIARTTTWKRINYSNRSVTQFAAMGDTTIGGNEYVDTWGSNRFNQTFTNQYLERFVSDSYCGFWRPRSGSILHKTNGNKITATYGVNEAGKPDSRDCAYGWKLHWELANGQHGEKTFSY